jgi:hypothetical protein
MEMAPRVKTTKKKRHQDINDLIGIISPSIRPET